MIRIDHRTVELTEPEIVLKQVHENLMDRGMCQSDAILAMTGIDLPGSRELCANDPFQIRLMSILDGPFLAYLAD